MSNIIFTKNDGIFEMLKWKNDAKIGNDADLIYKQGGTMAYIKKKSERKFKITVCNGYKVNRFKLILKANNLPLDLNVHSLRHTNASLLIAQGVDVRTVASPIRPRAGQHYIGYLCSRL